MILIYKRNKKIPDNGNSYFLLKKHGKKIRIYALIKYNNEKYDINTANLHRLFVEPDFD